MDPHPYQNPHFYALDIILAYLNKGNTAHEIAHLSHIASAWCRENPLHDDALMTLDQVLWAHPFLFDLSILSFSRLFTFNDCAARRNEQPFGPGQGASSLLIPHIRPLITAQQYFCTMIDAYTLHVGHQGRSFHDRIVAQDLKGSPIIHYMPEVIHRIAVLDARELLSSEFSTFSPKTSLGFSCHLAKGVEVMMMDAPPFNWFESEHGEDMMDIDREPPVARVNLDWLRVKVEWLRNRGLKRRRNCDSQRVQPWNGRKKRKTDHT
ncbi:hypothetical protein TARUN_9184 [Trichoderma arundinaceum]|uniref:Uncharacterized protein n=1 Tax=Trichoderma arundinaceum TaxID=490622 RepID=A0A395NAW3_TRIAR|nr:hypothetical protein TARUN_9184 [Trichoderma arundinaceum]